MYHTTLCPTKIQWVYRWREKAYSTDKGYNVFYAHFPSTGTIQFPGVGQHVACKRKMNTRGVSIYEISLFTIIYIYVFLHTLYLIDGYVIQGEKIEYELLLDVDWLYARTNTTLNTAFHHRLNFSQKRLSPFIRTLQHIGNFLEAKSSASCPIFYTFNGCVEYTKQSFARKVIYYPHARNVFCFVLQNHEKKVYIWNYNELE